MRLEPQHERNDLNISKLISKLVPFVLTSMKDSEKVFQRLAKPAAAEDSAELSEIHPNRLEGSSFKLGRLDISSILLVKKTQNCFRSASSALIDSILKSRSRFDINPRSRVFYGSSIT